MKIGEGSTDLSNVHRSFAATVQSGRGDALMVHLEKCSRRERGFHEAMHRMMGDLMPPLYPLTLRTKGGGSIEVNAVTLFDMLRVLHKTELYAQTSLLGDFDSSVLAKYWEQLRTSESWRESSNSNMLKQGFWEHRHVTYPVILHSDGGQVFEDTTYVTYHWCTPFTYNIHPKDCIARYHGNLVAG